MRTKEPNIIRDGKCGCPMENNYHVLTEFMVGELGVERSDEHMKKKNMNIV